MYTADPNVIPKPQVEKCCLVRQWTFSLRAYMYISSVTLLSMVLMPQRTHPMNETIVYESPWIRIGSLHAQCHTTLALSASLLAAVSLYRINSE